MPALFDFLTRFASGSGPECDKGSMHRLRKPSEHGFVLTTLGRSRQRLRLNRLSLTAILAEIDARPDPGRPVCGYHVKVGTERNPFWLHRSGDHYDVTDVRPFQPPFRTECEATLARTWFIEAMPDVATLCEPVYSPALIAV